MVKFKSYKVQLITFPKRYLSHFQGILGLKKKISGGSLCTGGAAGIWPVVLFGTTYFGEINIYGLSKDQTFRICSTFMNPEQFLLLVTYLFIQKFRNKKPQNIDRFLEGKNLTLGKI